jgi:hypothetical protein
VRNPRFSRRGLRRLLASRMWRHVVWFLRNLLRLSSEQKSKPRAEETGSNLSASPVVHLAMSVTFSPTSTCFVLKMEADSSETSVKIHQTRQHHVPGDSNLRCWTCSICQSVSSPKLFQEFRLNVRLCTESYDADNHLPDNCVSSTMKTEQVPPKWWWPYYVASHFRRL